MTRRGRRPAATQSVSLSPGSPEGRGAEARGRRLLFEPRPTRAGEGQDSLPPRGSPPVPLGPAPNGRYPPPQTSRPAPLRGAGDFHTSRRARCPGSVTVSLARGDSPGGTFSPLPASTVVSFERVSVMILPQVHLRKPCYDFYFL